MLPTWVSYVLYLLLGGGRVSDAVYFYGELINT